MLIKNLLRIAVVLLFCSCQEKTNKDYIILDGIKFPIDGCIEAQKTTTVGTLNATLFCKCLIPKLYNEFKNDPEKLQLLKDGQIDKVSNDNIDKVGSFYTGCLSESTTDSSLKFNFTPQMKETMRNEFKGKLVEAGMDKTNDLNKYCDCYINGLQNDFSIREILDTGFNQSEKFKKLTEKCSEVSKKQ